jgi:DNA ligase 1
MERFAALFDRIDQTTSTNQKVEAMAEYFAIAPPRDAAWALYFLIGRKIRRLLKSRDLWAWTVARTGLEPWLMEESYSVVGDMAETMALLVDRDDLPPPRAHQEPAQAQLPFAAVAIPQHASAGLAEWIEERVMLLPALDRAAQMQAVFTWWSQLRGSELFLFNKLLTGEMRVGVSQRLVVRALARFSGLDEATIAHRLTGDWQPSSGWFERLVAPGAEADGDITPRPYPFFLASPLTEAPESLGDIGEWLLEHKYDGIRAQLIRRGGRVSLWSRGDELITDRFPEIRDGAAQLPDGCVLDGEVLAWRGGPLAFALLQRRIGRVSPSARILAEAPAAFIAFDLLEEGGRDIRGLPLRERRDRLERVLGTSGLRAEGTSELRQAEERSVGASRRGVPSSPTHPLFLSPLLAASDWAQAAALRTRSRELNVEGVMIKRLSSAYQVGRRRGDWWKWKIEPYAVDAVLVYAQPGHGRRANLLTDYTFAVWDRGELTPVAKAYSGLNNEEIAELDRWIRQHTMERYGPVRAVQPVHIFELHFEGIAESDRHRSGVALRFPRIARWRRDKRPQDADTLERIKELLRAAR